MSHLLGGSIRAHPTGRRGEDSGGHRGPHQGLGQERQVGHSTRTTAQLQGPPRHHRQEACVLVTRCLYSWPCPPSLGLCVCGRARPVPDDGRKRTKRLCVGCARPRACSGRSRFGAVPSKQTLSRDLRVSWEVVSVSTGGDRAMEEGGDRRRHRGC